MQISIIAAIDRHRAIGYQNRLLFRLPNDLKRFKQLTVGHTVIMGRKTFESLPKGALPDRRNIVLTRQPGIHYPQTDTYTSLEAALRNCHPNDHVFIIGGESIYQQALPIASELLLTEVDAEAPQADAYFPAFSADHWQESRREFHAPDEKHSYPYAFVDYHRIARLNAPTDK